MAKQSERLTGFYQEYLSWLNQDAPKSTVFKRNSGLCHCYFLYCQERGMNPGQAGVASGEMHRQFKDAGLDILVPFNNYEDGATWEDTHCYECDEYACHLNPKRIQWVKDHANG